MRQSMQGLSAATDLTLLARGRAGKEGIVTGSGWHGMARAIGEGLVLVGAASNGGIAAVRNTDRTNQAAWERNDATLTAQKEMLDRKLAAAREARLLELADQAGRTRREFRGNLIAAGLSSATQLVSAHMQIKSQERMQQREHEHEALEAELERQGRVAVQRQQAEYAERQISHQGQVNLDVMRARAADDRYPFADGPGFLSASLSMISSSAGRKAVLVLISPAARSDGEGTPWHGVCALAKTEIQRYHRLVRQSDRPFHWPHPKLYESDLAGRPTIILQATATQEMLAVSLGGCHLNNDAFDPCQDSIDLLRLGLLDLQSWTPDLVQRINETSATGPVFRPPQSDDDAMLIRLNKELAARVIALYAIARLDCRNLLTTPGYDEQIDQAVQAAAVFDGDWPLDWGMPLWKLADPAYHLLHRARRYAWRSNPQAAELETCLALSVLAGYRDVPLDATTMQLVDVASRSAVTRPYHLQLAAEVLDGIPGAATATDLLKRALQTRPEMSKRFQAAGYDPDNPSWL